MIKKLIVKNFAIIKDLSIDFNNGFNVLTGETGAGKTVIINALSMLLGSRNDSSNIKNKKSEIIGVFDIDDSIIEELLSIDLEIENPAIIRRVLKTDGKSSAYINDIPITLNTLKKIGILLIDIHGQHDHQLLLDNKFQLKIIDDIAGNMRLLNEFANMKLNYKQLLEERDKLQNEINDFQKEKDYLQFVYKELSEVSLENYDEENINERFNEIANAEILKDVLNNVYNTTLENEDISLSKIINSIVYQLNSIKISNAKLKNIIKMYSDISILIEETGNEVKNLQESVYYDENELNELKSFIDSIEKLKHKYSMNVEELINYRNNLEKKLRYLNSPDDTLEEINAKIESVRTNLIKIGNLIYENRKKSAEKFENNVNSILKQLNMSDSKIIVKIMHDIDTINNYGFDNLEFLLINKFNTDGAILKKIVSGGELSRIMLAIKATIKSKDIVGSMIFDEIDAGISGETADMVAQIIKKLGKHKQIIVITHLPQIASYAKSHYFVKKEPVFCIEKIDGEERIREIARLLGASMSKQTAYNHAKALLGKK